MLSNYVSAMCGADGSGVQPGGISASVYSDDKPIVGFVLEGGAACAGARHLEGLVSHVRSMLDALRGGGREVFLLWAPRGTQGIRRVDGLARQGDVSDAWPDGLMDLLRTSSDEYLAATAEAQSIMDKY